MVLFQDFLIDHSHTVPEKTPDCPALLLPTGNTNEIPQPTLELCMQTIILYWLLKHLEHNVIVKKPLVQK